MIEMITININKQITSDAYVVIDIQAKFNVIVTLFFANISKTKTD